MPPSAQQGDRQLLGQPGPRPPCFLPGLRAQGTVSPWRPAGVLAWLQMTRKAPPQAAGLGAWVSEAPRPLQEGQSLSRATNQSRGGLFLSRGNFRSQQTP